MKIYFTNISICRFDLSYCHVDMLHVISSAKCYIHIIPIVRFNMADV